MHPALAFLYVLVGALCCTVVTALDCAGGYNNGDVINKGVYWYRCNNGAFEASGCLSNTGRRLNVGESFVNNQSLEITCVRNQGYLMYAQTACMYKGQRVAPNQAFEDTQAWFMCERVGDLYLLWKPAGCMYNGKRLSFFDRVRENETLFECHRKGNPGAALQLMGCAKTGSQDRLLGEQYQDDKYLYTCESNGSGRAVQSVFGCIYKGERYYDYQVYRDGEQIFRCHVNENRTSASAEVCGCVQYLTNAPPIEKLIGCYWPQDVDEPGTREGYLMNCKVDDAGRAYVERVRCLYTADEGYKVELDAGCFRPLWKSDQSIGCVPSEKGVQIKIFPTDRLDIAFGYRLRFC